MTLEITVCTPTIPPRVNMLARAMKSAINQTLPPRALSVAIDTGREGAWVTRTRAVMGATTEWVALLDDDDYFYEDHLETLALGAEETGADYVYSWFNVVGGTDPLDGRLEQWRPGLQTTTTVLVRTKLAQEVGWHLPNPDDTVGRHYAGEDYQFVLDCANAGAKIHHVTGVKTWVYSHHGLNTSGLPDRVKKMYGQ